MKKLFCALLLLCWLSGLTAATAPTLTSVGLLTSGGGVALGDEDTPIVISYATLVAAANEADVDGGTIDFRVEGVTIGTLVIRVAGSATAGTAIVPGTTILDAGHELVWTPTANSSGDLPAFTVVAWDGALASSSAVQANVRVAAINDVPTLTTIATIAAGGGAPLGDEDTEMIITSTALFAAADEFDVDGTVGAFRIANITAGGTLGLRALGSGSAATPVAVGDLVDSTMELVWTPPLNANGTVVACAVRAWDGNNNSATAVALPVLVNPVFDNFDNEAFNFTPIPIVVGVPVTLTFAELLAHTTFSDPDRDAFAAIRNQVGHDPLAGWKFESLDAVDAVLATSTAAAPTQLFIQRDEKLRITVDAALTIVTPNNDICGLDFNALSSDHSTLLSSSQTVRMLFHVSVGGSSSVGSGGGGGGCGLGAVAAGLIALLGLALRGRMWYE
jgi:hypothetical protein